MQDIVLKLKSLIKKEPRVVERRPSRMPYRDWVILFITAILLCFAIAGFAGYAFLGVKNGNLFGITPTANNASIKKFNEKNLTTTLADYKQRADEYEAILKKKEVIADPSL